MDDLAEQSVGRFNELFTRDLIHVLVAVFEGALEVDLKLREGVHED